MAYIGGNQPFPISYLHEGIANNEQGLQKDLMLFVTDEVQN